MQEAEHHGDRWFKDAVEQSEARQNIEAILKELKTAARLGETGSFPDRAMTPDDAGEIRFAVTAQAGKVVLAFGKPIEWIGLRPLEARQLADALNKWAALA